jgi:hypothetical protein
MTCKIFKFFLTTTSPYYIHNLLLIWQHVFKLLQNCIYVFRFMCTCKKVVRRRRRFHETTPPGRVCACSDSKILFDVSVREEDLKGRLVTVCTCICGSRFERDLITRSCKELSVVHSGQKIGQSENDFFFCNGKGLVPGTNVKISDFFPPEKLAKKWHFRLKIRCLLKIISYFLAENWSKSPKILIILCKPLFLATLKQHK